MPDTVVVFVPQGPQAGRWTDACAEYCQEHDYRIVAVASTWPAVMQLIWGGGVQVVVTARQDHLPPDREPRLEVIDEPQTHPRTDLPPDQRRTRRQSWAALR